MKSSGKEKKDRGADVSKQFESFLTLFPLTQKLSERVGGEVDLQLSIFSDQKYKKREREREVSELFSNISRIDFESIVRSIWERILSVPLFSLPQSLSDYIA